MIKGCLVISYVGDGRPGATETSANRDKVVLLVVGETTFSVSSLLGGSGGRRSGEVPSIVGSFLVKEGKLQRSPT